MVHIGVYWYINWVAFIEQGSTRDSVFNALDTPQSVAVVSDFTVVLDAVIADSILVSHSTYHDTQGINRFAV